jgi:CDP-glycerol glycerophosphotransferase (TagB/SpsB family)
MNIRALLTRKDPKIWVFGAIRGHKYTDNARYLFEYVNEHMDVKAVWLSRSPEVVKTVRAKGYRAFLFSDAEGRSYARRAKVAVITHRGTNGNADLPYHLFTTDTMIVQLWHGIPLKKIAYDDEIFINIERTERAQLLRSSMFGNIVYTLKTSKIADALRNAYYNLAYYNKLPHNPVLIPALSDETKHIFAQAFRVDPERVMITGYPRNDILLRSRTVDGKHPDAAKKVIYMPTFRDKVGSQFDLFLQYGFDVATLDRELEAEKMTLYIKLHPFNQPTQALLEQIAASNNIRFLEEDAIYEILSEFDILVTDYSSIYFDFLLLDRPIVFSPFDLDQYLVNDREMYYDYDAVTPGPKSRDWNEVIVHLKAFGQDPSLFKDERRMIRDRFHTYQDGGSSQRICRAIEGLLKKEHEEHHDKR